MFPATMAAILFFAPLFFFAARLATARAAATQCAAMALALAAAVFLCMARHQDCYSGLDSASYAVMADDIRAGVPLSGPDGLYSSIPASIADAFLYRPHKVAGSPGLRITRSLAHELRRAPGGGFHHVPFYLPAHSLAAAGSRLGRLFMPIAGALFIATLLLAVVRRSGAAGIPPAIAALAATAYPAWFFRGDFAECSASVLALATLASHFGKPFRRPAAFAIAGFAVAFALSFHVTAVLLAAPIALLLFIDAPRASCRATLCAGLLAGFAPLWLTTRFLCAPYGDWTRLARLRSIAFSATEHAAVAGALFATAALAVAAVALAASPALRARVSRMARSIPFPAYLAMAAIPFALLAAAPGDTGAKFRLAAVFAARSTRAPAILLAAAGALALARAPRRHAALFVLLAGSACAFMLVFGQESFATHAPRAGIWGFRRLLPPVLACATIIAFPLADAFRSMRGRTGRLLGAAAFAVAALANPLRSPTAYFAINGRGAEQSAQAIRNAIDASGADLVVSDYFPHHVPLAAGGRPVIGVAPHAYAKWGAISAWLAGLAATSNVWIASSYNLPACEERFAFASPRAFEIRRSVVKAKAFLDAVAVPDAFTNTLARVVPFGPGSPVPGEQRIAFDGSPVAMRGPWQRAARGGFWSRGGSGFVAPLPQPGLAIEAEFDLEWTPPEGGPENQILRIDFPGNPYLAVLKVGKGRHTVKAEFATEKPLPLVGHYTVSAPRPFDPAAYGIGGYPNDLGVVFHEARIRTVPLPPR